MNYIALVISCLFHVIIIVFSYMEMSGFFNDKIKDSGYRVFEFVEIGSKSKAPVLSKTDGKLSKIKATKKEKDEIKIKNQPKESAAKEKKSKKKTEKIVPLKKKTTQKKEIKKTTNKTKNNTSKTSQKAVVNLRKNQKSNKNKDKKAASKSFNSALDSALAKSNNENSGINAEDFGDVLTATQIDLIRQTIRKCWHFPAGLKNAEDLIVDIKMELDQSGTVKKAEILNKLRMNSDNDFKIAAENAYRAVLDPKCNPLPLPKEKYKEWKELELSFNPKDMFD